VKKLLIVLVVGTVCNTMLSQGVLIPDTIVVDEMSRSFLVYLPDGYEAEEPLPLLFNLHGAGMTPEEQLYVTSTNEVADSGRFIVVYPKGVLNSLNTTGWNSDRTPNLQDDVAFVNAMIDSISAEYTIDLSRVYACGLSNGAVMCHTLACDLSDRITAIAAVSAPLAEPMEHCRATRPIPVLYMHGTADKVVPYEGGPGFVPIDFMSAETCVMGWIEHDKCSEVPQMTKVPDIVKSDSSTVIVQRYTHCSETSEVVFYIVQNGGHVWPGTIVPDEHLARFGHVNRDINASEEIWNFLKRFSM